MFWFISILAVFFALNMGGASFAASFASAYGGRTIGRYQAGLLFVIFVILGAVLFGQNVAHTLGKGLVPAQLLTSRALIVIFLSAGASMLVANLMNIPQSTSLVTVAAIAGVGLFYQDLRIDMILFMLPFWLLLPVLSYGIAYAIGRYVYPPRKINFWIYERLVNHQKRLKFFVILCGCYNALSVGSNNVANVAGPFVGLDNYPVVLALLVFAVFYGGGAFVFQGPLKTAGEKVVPLGLLTASIISLVSSTLMLTASGLGIPQSFVMLQVGALYAIATLKDGPEITFGNSLARSTFLTWTVNPVITLFVSYGMCFLFIGR